MSGFLIFLAVALWFGLKIRQAYQKQMSELGSGTPSDEGTVKNVYESRFDSSRVANHSNTSSSFSSEVGSAGYFTYESDVATPMASSVATSRPSYQDAPFKSVVPTGATSNEAESAVVFDLRQAVIYDLILNNKYLSDIQSSEIN